MQGSCAVHQGYRVTTQGLQCGENKSACIFRKEPKQSSEGKRNEFGEEVITAESDWAMLRIKGEMDVIPTLDIS